MPYEELNFEEFKIKAEAIENLNDRIKFVSSEILKCELEIENVQNDYREIELDFFRFNMSTTKKGMELYVRTADYINKDKELKREAIKFTIDKCVKSRILKLNIYMRNINSLIKNYEKNYMYNRKKNGNGNGNGKLQSGGELKYRNEDLIVWTRSEELLLKLFEPSDKINSFEKCRREEILIHFKNEKDIPFCKADIKLQLIKWRGSDSFFLILIDRLILERVIRMGNVQKLINMHFCNNQGMPFKCVWQKINYSKNYTHLTEIIERNLKKIEII